MSTNNAFGRFANATADAAGHPLMFAFALLIIGVWAATGPLFHYSDTWQLVINTGTTIVTFLMVFLIQNTQNRDSKAIQIKLDELIRATEGHNVLLDLEELSATDLKRIQAHYHELAQHAREAIRQGLLDTDHPDIELGEAVARALLAQKKGGNVKSGR
jgi:low affinity Fe/Cu permease